MPGVTTDPEASTLRPRRPPAVRFDRDDHVVVDDDVDVVAQVGAVPVPDPAGVNDRASGRAGVLPRQRHADGARRPAVGGDDPKPPVVEVQQLAGIPAPTRRIGDLGGDLPGGAGGRAVRRHRHHPQHAGHDERHHPAVRRPHRAVVAAGLQRPVRQRLVIRGLPGRAVDGQDLAQALAVPRRIRLDRRDGDRVAVGRPGRTARFERRRVDPLDVARADLHRVDGAGLVEEGDEPPVAGPGSGDGRGIGQARYPGVDARAQIAHPDLQVAAPVAGVRQLRAVRRPGGIRLPVVVLRQRHGRLANAHKVNVVERPEGNLLAVRRQHRAADAFHRRSRAGREVALPLDVIRRHGGHLRGHVDRLRCAGADRATADVPVRGVDERIR